MGEKVATMREPFTEPYTARERLIIRYDLMRYDVKGFFRNGLWMRLANRLPRRLAYFAMVRVYAHAWFQAGDRTPDKLTYEEVCKRWEGKPVD